MPESVTDRPTNCHEHIFLLTKSARYYYDADAVREYAAESKRQRRDRVGRASHEVPQQHSEGREFVGSNTRNLRNVWSIPTQGYAGAHFATFPEALVVPMVRAGCPAHACAECGKPWARIVKKRDLGFADRTFRSPHETGTKGMTNGRGATTLAHLIQRETLGFRPTCSCPAGTPTVPGLEIGRAHV